MFNPPCYRHRLDNNRPCITQPFETPGSRSQALDNNHPLHYAGSSCGADLISKALHYAPFDNTQVRRPAALFVRTLAGFRLA